nr:hypothetical protein [Tanacetum cinerariifolium]
MEDKIDNEVDRVLTAIASDTTTQHSEAVRKERLKQPTQTKKKASYTDSVYSKDDLGYAEQRGSNPSYPPQSGYGVPQTSSSSMELNLLDVAAMDLHQPKSLLAAAQTDYAQTACRICPTTI